MLQQTLPGLARINEAINEILSMEKDQDRAIP